MITDGDVEARLRRYRPLGPPETLRTRCVTLTRQARWPYVAAAALLFSALGLYRATNAVQPATLRPDADIAEIATWLGGGPEAERAAWAGLARFQADEALRHARSLAGVGGQQETVP